MRRFEGMDSDHLYYILEPVYDGNALQMYVRADNAAANLRPVISADEANRLIDSIPTAQTEAFYSRSAQELASHYEQVLKQSPDCRGMLSLVLSIYNKKMALSVRNKKFSRIDEQYMKQTENALNGELAVALQIDRAKIPDYIASRVRAIASSAGQTSQS